MWVRAKYESSPELGVEPVNDLEFEDWVDKERAEYECTCGVVIEGYDAMVEHLERANGT